MEKVPGSGFSFQPVFEVGGDGFFIMTDSGMDLNGNGKKEFVLVNMASPFFGVQPPAVSKIQVYENDGDNNYKVIFDSTGTNLPIGGALYRDTDQDGIPELIIGLEDRLQIWEFSSNAGSTPEVCDGIDNDLDSFIDEGFPDTDADGLADCVDTDSDNDGVLNSFDNCPLEANPDQSNLDNQDGGDVCDVCPNDAADTCNQTRSAGGTIGPAGGIISAPDGSVVIVIPPGALNSDTSISITDSGNGVAYELTTNLGNGTALFGVSLQPAGVLFNVPITITFNWQDTDNNGIIDGTNIREDVVRITKNNNVVTDKCQQEPGPLTDTVPECSTINNYFRIRTTSFSDWSLWAEASSALANISTRGMVQTGDNVMIGGFIISGTAPRSVLIRGFGPTLADFGVTGALANPYIELYSGKTLI